MLVTVQYSLEFVILFYCKDLAHISVAFNKTKIKHAQMRESN